MAKEYIEREAVKRELLSWAVCMNHPEYLMKDDALHVIDSIPAADVFVIRTHSGKNTVSLRNIHTAPTAAQRWIRRIEMIAEYITLEQAAEAFAIQTVFSTNDCLDMLYYAIQKGWISPSDVTPVRHAKWVDNHCTACGMMPMGDEMWKKHDCDPPLFDRFMDYCPNCGCRMDGGAE